MGTWAAQSTTASDRQRDGQSGAGFSLASLPARPTTVSRQIVNQSPLPMNQ